MKRFYKNVSLNSAGQVLLDDKPVRTPMRKPLLVSHPRLATAIVGEWAAQGEQIRPRSMPLTGLANAVIDHIGPAPASHVATLAAYANSDLLCYRATPDQADLAAKQAREWNPILDWAEQKFGIIFTLANGVVPIDQPAPTRAALAAAVQAHSAWQLAALVPLVTIGGSLVAALALVAGAFAADDLWQATILDDLWQEAQWGADADAQATRAHHKADWDAAATFLSLIDD
jgi:chaperone required for assembly of F1-ATPase